MDIMRYSPYGALSQAFIISAIVTACEETIKAGPEAMNTPFVSGAAWHGVAKDILARYKDEYERKENQRETI